MILRKNYLFVKLTSIPKVIEITVRRQEREPHEHRQTM